MTPTQARNEPSGELKPCPFCGGKAAYGATSYNPPLTDAEWDDGSPVTLAHSVNCISCAGQMRPFVGGFRTKEQAAAAWNTRARST